MKQRITAVKMTANPAQARTPVFLLPAGRPEGGAGATP